MWRKFPRSISAANLVTEISSSDYRQQIDLAQQIRQLYRKTLGIVDVD